MNKEQEELLDEVYLAYADSHWTSPSNPNGKLLSEQLFGVIPMEHSKESFINEIKTNSKFSKKWGLKIEERELSYEERKDIWNKNNFFVVMSWHNMEEDDRVELLNGDNIPTKLITVNYKNEKIEVYE
jgi:hypothetical protein